MGKDRIIMTLCIVRQGPSVLLGMKKRGFGAGRWNGFGGKMHEGEQLLQVAKRELEEESGLRALSLIDQGTLVFEYQDTGVIHETHVFSCEAFEGLPQETEEMKPQWFQVSEIPYEEMWPDDRYWFPLLLAGKRFSGTFIFQGTNTINTKYQATLIRHSLHLL